MDNLATISSHCALTTRKFWSLVKLVTNWSGYFLQNTRLPETVDAAVDRLMAVLEDEAKSVIRSMTEDDLIDLHFCLGTAIRNAFSLHDGNGKLLASCGVSHPDDASSLIIQTLWKQLN